MTLPFHPLADLFPLIEGAEFDDLVVSIKEGGQHDTIILLDGMILDGRNRYRACLAAGIEPRTRVFEGTDPVRFVMDHNIHRRHLNESQRGMIAAKLSTMKHGGDRSKVEISTLPASKAAEMLNIDRHTVFAAKKVLSEGTAEEIKAVEQGTAAVSTIARQIRAKMPRERRAAAHDTPQSQRGKNPQRIENQRINGEIWGRVRDALTHLTSLPLPSDVVAIVRAHDKAGHVDARIKQALSWLEGFSHEWGNGNQTQAANGKAGNRHVDAGEGDRAA